MNKVTFNCSLLLIITFIVGLSLFPNPFSSTHITETAKNKPITMTESQIRNMYGRLWAVTGEIEKYVPLDIVDNVTVNAEARASGITLYKGLMNYTYSEDELALILAHEIAHVVLMHVDDARPSSEEDTAHQEAQADKYGAFLMMKAGYSICDGRGVMLRWFEKFGDGLGQSHPPFSYRFLQLDVQCPKSV